MDIGNFLGALFGTGATGDTLFHVNEAGALDQINLKVALFAAKTFDFGEREYVNIDMPADLDQFGGNNSHRTIIGGEGFIQLRHHSPDRA